MITPDDVIAFKRVCNKSALGNRAMDSNNWIYRSGEENEETAKLEKDFGKP